MQIFLNVDLSQRLYVKTSPSRNEHHYSKKVFVPEALKICTYVFVRDDKISPSLQQPYYGPFKITSRHEKAYKLLIGNNIVNVSTDKLEAAYVEEFDNILFEGSTKGSYIN